MGVSVADLRKQVKRPVRSVAICLDGELWDRHDELTRALDEMQNEQRGKMGDPPQAQALKDELRDVEEQMKAAQVVLKFRGISTYRLAAIQAKYPDPLGRQAWSVTAGAHALIAACAVEPEMSEDEAHDLLEELHHAAADKLVGAAWLATTGSSDIPFSVRASALISGSGSK